MLRKIGDIAIDLNEVRAVRPLGSVDFKDGIGIGVSKETAKAIIEAVPKLKANRRKIQCRQKRH